MSKILFIDVDGTLVDYENHLPDSAVRAIRAARAMLSAAVAPWPMIWKLRSMFSTRL